MAYLLLRWSEYQKKLEGVRLMNLIKMFLREEEGVTSIEYALIAVLIALSIIAGATVIGTNVQTTFNNVAAQLP